MSGRTPWKIQILIYLLAFGCFYQQSVLLPVLPRFAGDLDLSVTMIGIVLSARFVLPAFFAAQIGEWTARFGLKKSLFWAGVLTIVTTPLYMIADNIWLLLLAQIVSGSLYMASWIASQTYATRVPDRDWVLGIFATVTAVGMTVGPVIGGMALDLGGYNTAFLSYAAGALLMAVTSWFLGNHAAGQPTEPRPRAKGQLAVLLKRPGLQAAFL
ncbi:MAG TPA: MFS transporter, partial [Deinococcales bacterium]|nr:MFS transporter [Deinococcales bacterium]